MQCRMATMATVVFLALLPLAATAGGPEYDGYAALLAGHVHAGRVDYAGLKQQETLLDAFLEQLAGVDPEALSPSDQFAYYINVYNAWTIKLILTRYPGLRSIKDAGSLFRSPWKQNIVRLPGGLVSLDVVEHHILRPRFKDPRLHFAINCASRSCPPLADAPYRGETLDAALDAVTRSFINAPGNTVFKDGKLHVSRLFDWYAEDFGGPEGVWTFLRQYAGPDLAKRMGAAASRELAYTEYDWSLNGR
jgi:hypothetical protein